MPSVRAGWSIDAIREFILLSAHPGSLCADADRIAGQQLEATREKIIKLQALERELERIDRECKNGRVDKCYVLRSLSDHSLCADEH